MAKALTMRLYKMRRLVDLLILVLSFYGVELFSMCGLATPINPPQKNQILLLFILILTWFVSAVVTKLYKDRVSNNFVEEIVIVLNAGIIQFIIVAAILFISKSTIDAGFIIAVLVLFALLQVLVKYFIRKKMHWSFFNDQTLSQKLLLIGTASSIEKLSQTLTTHFYYGYHCIGYVSDQDYNIQGLAWLGTTNNLGAIIDEQQVQKVIVSLPSLTEESIRFYLETCDAKNVKTLIVPNYEQFTSTTFEIDQIGLIPVLNLKSLPLDKYENELWKRIFDMVFSAAFLIFIASWLFPIVALLIKLTSKGPVFFVQERWGFNNTKMNCYKFRTMYVNTNGDGKFEHTIKNDPRVTPLGKWLRSWSIDEMPQFWSVLMGTMSVVGPRPHVTPQNVEYLQKIDSYLLRHQVKPGLTGWAQVNGARGEMPDIQHMQTRLNYDLYYIHRWSFWLDLQIILQTIVNLFKGDVHAY